MSLPIMPKDHIPAAGLELDKLIARQVLGWHQDNIILEWFENSNAVIPPRDYWYSSDRNPNFLGCFSTDIKVAWGLVEKFQLCVMPWDDGQWTATRLTQILADGETNKAPTAPHAICLAALFYAGEDDK